VRAAFTLLELILVLAVLGFLSAVAAARLGGLRTGQQVEQAARTVQDQIQRCQRLASARSQAVRLRLDLDAHTTEAHLLGAGMEQDPPDGQPELATLDGDSLAVSYTADSGSLTTTGTVDLLFLPDGICDLPGALTITQGERTATVQCHLGSQPPTRLVVAEAAR
jgi:type II secretion system protein H